MHYDPNYRNQFFHNSANRIGIREAVDILRRELAVREVKTPMPKTKTSKIVLFSLLGIIALILLISAVIWIVSKSLLLTIVLFVLMAFLSVGIMSVVFFVSEQVHRRSCTEAVDAVCIGYSISGDGANDNGGGVSRTPVFEYEYHGYKYTAFDGVYDNFSALPAVLQETKILINPSDPEDIVWNFGKKRGRFLILAGAFATVLSLAIFFVILNDENFMNSALGDDAPDTEAGSTGNSGSEVSSGEEEFVVRHTDDGRIILDDAYIRNEIWYNVPDVEYVIKVRKIKEVETANEGSLLNIRFEPDPDFIETEWFFEGPELTDEIRSLKPGDEMIFAEAKNYGYLYVFSTTEYVLEAE